MSETVTRPEARTAQAARLRAAVRTLVHRFSLSERADVDCCGLTVAQAATLEALRGSPPLRLGALGRRLGITPSTLTRNLVRLESEGLVARRDDGGDGRAVRVSLTAAGERAAAQVERREAIFAADVLARLPAGRREAVVESLHELLAAVRGATEKCCPGAFDHLLEGAGEPTGSQRRIHSGASGVGGSGDAKSSLRDERRPRVCARRASVASSLAPKGAGGCCR